jgi:hypothetical protein
VTHRLRDDRGDAVRDAGKRTGDGIGPDANAMTSGLNVRTPVPPGDSFESRSGSVVGEGWPLVITKT